MFLFKELAILVAGIFIGFTFATMMLYPQIEKRYVMGQDNGYSSGVFRVIGFLSSNFSENGNALSKKPPDHLEIKGRRIEIIKKNGVRTLKVR